MSASATSPRPFGPSAVAELLNRAQLRVNSEVRTATLTPERTAVKHRGGRRVLVVTPAQWALVKDFGTGRTVPQRICELITANRCPPLREFYELVVRAADAGVLQAEGAGPLNEPAPAAWALKLGGGVVRVFALAAMAGAVVLLLWRPVLMPVHPAWLAIGWATVAAAASLGNLLAAAVVKGAGGDVFRPRFDWRTPLPRFRADLDDAVMGGRRTQIDAALARLLPHFAFLAAAAWWVPSLVLPLLAGVLVVLSPLWPSPLLDLLAAFHRDPQLTTTYGFGVARSRLLALLGEARRRMAGGTFLLACALATLVWLATVLVTGLVLLDANAEELWARFQSGDGWRWTALVLLALLGTLAAGAVGAAAWIAWGQLRDWWREGRDRRLRPRAVLMSGSTIAEWLGRTVLFRDLPAGDLAEVAAAVKPEEHKRGSFVVREGEPGDKLFVIVSGRLEVRRDYAPGRSEPVAEMGEGEVFGEIALLEGGVRTRSVGCRSAAVLLALAREDFERLVRSRLSREAVADAVQKVGFLQGVPLTRDWSASALGAFSRRAKLREYAAAAVVMQEGEPNHCVFLVHRGEVAVRQGARELRRLAIGEAFGELSLLGDGRATATVVVTSKSASCLIVGGKDFLEFVTQDFAAGLRWEEVIERQRGGPLFGPGAVRS